MITQLIAMSESTPPEYLRKVPAKKAMSGFGLAALNDTEGGDRAEIPPRSEGRARSQRSHRTLRNRYTCGAQSARTARRLSSDGRATHS